MARLGTCALTVVRLDADARGVRIVVGHDNSGQWWWTAHGENGAVVATSILYASRSDCQRAIAELKVEGPAASVAISEGEGATPLAAVRQRRS
jgi:uncharacterized protein YegP (UPF0339 family)